MTTDHAKQAAERICDRIHAIDCDHIKEAVARGHATYRTQKDGKIEFVWLPISHKEIACDE